MKTISVIIPAYNEEQHIIPNILTVAAAIHGLGYKIQIIVVDDGSTDRTLAYLNEYFKGSKDFIILHNRENLGKGAAVRAGLKYATGSFIVLIDADLDIAPYQIRLLLDMATLTSKDVVIGSKMHPCSIVKYPLSRRICSLVYYWIIKILFGLSCHDTQTGLKLFTAKAIKKVVFGTDGFAFDLEILVKLNNLGFKIAEAPIVLRQKRNFGRIGANDVWKTWWDTWKLYRKLKKGVGYAR